MASAGPVPAAPPPSQSLSMTLSSQGGPLPGSPSLDAGQSEVVAADLQTPLLVKAGPGAGKTRVLVQRIVRLVHGAQVTSDQILPITFSRRAMLEMNERLRTLLGPRAPAVYTFHSFAHMLCRRHASFLQRKRNFTIYGGKQQLELMLQCIAAVVSFLPSECPTREEVDQRLRIVLQQRQEGSTPEPSPLQLDPQYLDLRPDEYHAKMVLKRVQKARANCTTGELSPVDSQLLGLYLQRLDEMNAVDMVGMLELAVRILTSVKGIEAYHKAYILVDEFQDTNALQLSMLTALCPGGRTITCVGDDDQSIYSFRGTVAPGVFRQAFPQMQIAQLCANYRSHPAIVACLNSLIAHNPGRMMAAPMTPVRGGDLCGGTPGAAVVVTQCRNQDCELALLAQSVADMYNQRQWKLSQMAILCRQRRVVDEVSAFLGEHGIRFRVKATDSAYKRPDTQGILAVLRLLVNEGDDTAANLILAQFGAGFSHAGLTAIAEHARAARIPVVAAITRLCQPRERGNPLLARASPKKRAREAAAEPASSSSSSPAAPKLARADLDIGVRLLALLSQFKTAVNGCRSMGGVIQQLPSMYAALKQLRASSTEPSQMRTHTQPWYRWLHKMAEQHTRLGDAAAVAPGRPRLASPLGGAKRLGPAEFDAIAELRSFLDGLALNEKDPFADTECEAANKEDSDDALTITTIHQAKGLEWPVVFVPRFNQGMLPMVPDFRSTDHRPINDAECAEERRMAFVAISRAQAKVHISFVDFNTMSQALQPSMFLRELPKEQLFRQTIDKAPAVPKLRTARERERELGDPGVPSQRPKTL